MMMKDKMPMENKMFTTEKSQGSSAKSEVNELKHLVKKPMGSGEGMNFGSAVSFLNKELERGEHAPMVGGHKNDSCTH